LLFTACYLPLTVANAARVAIVIDDIGYRTTDHSALDLPGDITFSILPHTPFAVQLAQRAHDENHDVLLHIPMEAENGKKLGPGALTSDMNEQSIRQSLAKSFAEIPFAIGINNHMGSLLTQRYQSMTWTMRYLKERNVMFLDSKTSNHSQAARIANNLEVPTLNRSVFLDNRIEAPYIQKQFELLVKRAKKYHSAIAIAHPHPETIATLNKLIPLLKQQGIDLVPISALLPPNTENNALMAVAE
jgi:hypothetical protein